MTAGTCQQIAEIPGFEAYYAVYALPQGVVRVRAELPRIVAGNEEVGNFARALITRMSPPR